MRSTLADREHKLRHRLARRGYGLRKSHNRLLPGYYIFTKHRYMFVGEELFSLAEAENWASR